MNKNLKIRTTFLAGLALVLGLAIFGRAVPALADGGGWPTATFTITATVTSPLDLFFTPVPGAGTQPAVIVPDTGAALTFEEELATIQAEVQMTSAAQGFQLTPTAAPATENKGMSPLLMVAGLVVSIAVLAFLGFRLLRR